MSAVVDDIIESEENDDSDSSDPEISFRTDVVTPKEATNSRKNKMSVTVRDRSRNVSLVDYDVSDSSDSDPEVSFRVNQTPKAHEIEKPSEARGSRMADIVEDIIDREELEDGTAGREDATDRPGFEQVGDAANDKCQENQSASSEPDHEVSFKTDAHEAAVTNGTNVSKDEMEIDDEDPEVSFQTKAGPSKNINALYSESSVKNDDMRIENKKMKRTDEKLSDNTLDRPDKSGDSVKSEVAEIEDPKRVECINHLEGELPCVAGIQNETADKSNEKDAKIILDQGDSVSANDCASQKEESMHNESSPETKSNLEVESSLPKPNKSPEEDTKSKNDTDNSQIIKKIRASPRKQAKAVKRTSEEALVVGSSSALGASFKIADDNLMDTEVMKHKEDSHLVESSLEERFNLPMQNVVSADDKKANIDEDSPQHHKKTRASPRKQSKTMKKTSETALVVDSSSALRASLKITDDNLRDTEVIKLKKESLFSNLKEEHRLPMQNVAPRDDKKAKSMDCNPQDLKETRASPRKQSKAMKRTSEEALGGDSSTAQGASPAKILRQSSITMMFAKKQILTNDEDMIKKVTEPVEEQTYQTEKQSEVLVAAEKHEKEQFKDDDNAENDSENAEVVEENAAAPDPPIERMVHHPLPFALKKSEIFKGRERINHFKLRSLKGSVRIRKPLEIIYDRQDPENTKIGEDTVEATEEDVKENTKDSDQIADAKKTLDSRPAQTLLTAMSDLQARTVVLIGDVRLGSEEAAKRVRQYKDYEDKKRQNLIRMPKSKDGKFVKKGGKRKLTD